MQLPFENASLDSSAPINSMETSTEEAAGGDRLGMVDTGQVSSPQGVQAHEGTKGENVRGNLCIGVQLVRDVVVSNDDVKSAVHGSFDTYERKREPGLLILTVQKAAGLEATDRGGVSDPYVTIQVGKQTAQRTTVKEKTVNPTWDERFSFKIESMDDDVVLNVRDNDQRGGDYLGHVRLGTVGELMSAHPQMAGGDQVCLQQRLQSKKGTSAKDKCMSYFEYPLVCAHKYVIKVSTISNTHAQQPLQARVHLHGRGDSFCATHSGKHVVFIFMCTSNPI